MRKSGIVGIWVLVLATLAGVAYSQVPGEDYIIPAKDENGQDIPKTAIDWSTMEITADGEGVAPAGSTAAQGKIMACRAAEVLARRNLLEAVKGMPLTSETTVVNAVVQIDKVKTLLDGTVVATTMKKEYTTEGICQVVVRLGIHESPKGLARGKGSVGDAIIPAKPQDMKPEVKGPMPIPAAPAPPPEPVGTAEPAPAGTTIYSGIVIDARGLQARPAMSPQIVDDSGQVLYGSAFVSREYAIQYGMAGYTRSVDAAMNNERVTSKPLQVKATKATGSAKADLVLSEKDSNEVRAAAKNQSFLAKAKVMIVLD